MSAPAVVIDLTQARRRLKAAAILADPTHPQHQLIVDLVDTAIALDPPSDEGNPR